MMRLVKTVFCLLFSLLLSGGFALTAQSLPEDNINWTGIERALELAKNQDKLILIDVYAAWCPYCQRMQSEVYPDTAIEEKIRKYFIPVRINVESENRVTYLGNRFTEAEFARALQFRSVPMTYFMNKNGEVVGQQPGFLEVNIFSSLLEYVGSGAFEHQTYDEFSQQ